MHATCPAPANWCIPYLEARCNVVVQQDRAKPSERTREGRIARYTMSFTQAGENQYPTAAAKHVRHRAVAWRRGHPADHRTVHLKELRALVMAFASHSWRTRRSRLVQAAAAEIGGPAATTLRANAAALVYNTGQLGRDMDGAIAAIADIDKLEDLAFNALATYPAVVGTTLNRNQERANQAAIIDFVRALATVRFAERVGLEEYRDREQARANRDRSTEALDAREERASTNVFRALRNLRAGVVEHVREELLRLPPVIVATPASVQPSLGRCISIFMRTSTAPPISSGGLSCPGPASCRRTRSRFRGSERLRRHHHHALAALDLLQEIVGSFARRNLDKLGGGDSAWALRQ